MFEFDDLSHVDVQQLRYASQAERDHRRYGGVIVSMITTGLAIMTVRDRLHGGQELYRALVRRDQVRAAIGEVRRHLMLLGQDPWGVQWVQFDYA